MKTTVKTMMKTAMAQRLYLALGVWLGAGVFLAGVLLAGAAHAQSMVCVVDASTNLAVDFGTHTPEATNDSGVSTTPLRVRCSNNSNTTLRVRVCMRLGAGSGGAADGQRKMAGPPGAEISYGLYSDAARTQPILAGTTEIQVSSPEMAPGQGAIFEVARLYGRITSGQAVMPGVYASQFAPTQLTLRQRAYVLAAPTPSFCSQPVGNNHGFDVRVAVQPECKIVTLTPLHFGEHTAPLAGNLPGAAKLEVDCTPGTPYSIALGNGQFAQGNLRRMRHTSGSADHVRYELCHDMACQQRWGSVFNERKHDNTGTGGLKGYEIIGLVPGGQNINKPGLYQDQVVVTVEY